MAFILAGIVAVVTLVIAFLQAVAHADGRPDDWVGSLCTLFVGLLIAGLIAASHFLHMSW